MKKHKQYLITINPLNIDLVSGILWQLEIEGINETDFGLIVFAEAESNVNQKMISESLDNLIKENLLESFSIEETEIEEINWNEEWEKRLEVIHVTDKIVIKPTFKNYTAKKDDLVIVIDPKMSFGTGEHETTKLVLKVMEDKIPSKSKVLDIGSGTAVLSIAAAKLGADKVLAVDNDEWCLENGQENVERNEVENIVDVKLGELKDIEENDFDVVLANINKNILLELAPQIREKVKKNGMLILSGLLIADEEDIKSVYTKEGFHFNSSQKMNEWIALEFYR